MLIMMAYFPQTFVLHIDNAFPIHCLNAVKAVPEVAHVFCATNNPLQVVVAVSEVS